MAKRSRLDPEQLLQHEAFVRELAGRLVRDEQAADDIAQQTWVAALQAPAQPLNSLRGWLATIVRRTAGKRARGERRQQQREGLAANTEPAPSSSEILEREQARALVVRAVLALPESFRDVIVLRWFEGLPPRVIAKRLDVPVETVRTRHRRAMDQLRGNLDRGTDGGRCAWAAMLAPLAFGSGADIAAAAAAASATTATTTGVLLMSTNLKITAAIAVSFAVCCWLFWTPADTAPSGANGADEGYALASAQSQRGSRVESANAKGQGASPASNATVEREAVATSAKASKGIVVVNVRWAEDGTEAVGIPVEIFVGSYNHNAVSNEGGVARIEDVPPRRYFLVVKRPDGLENFKKVTVVGGEILTVDMEVPSGLDVHGVVVDENAGPIADAEVVIGDWGQAIGVVMARTDEYGKFAIRDLATNCMIGARAAGRAPSLMKAMTGSVGAEAQVRLVLDKIGARLTGIVLDENEQPVVGAFVRAGEATYRVIPFPDGSSGTDAVPAGQATDENGRFSFDALPPETIKFSVRSSGHAPYVQKVALRAGATEHLTIHIKTGVTIRGRVTMSDGKPVSCYVTASPGGVYQSDRDQSRHKSTKRDGTYEITGAAPGDLVLEVRSDDGEATHKLVAHPGQVLEWNPVLQAGDTLRGRIIDDDDKPVRVVVEVMAMASGKVFHRFATSDDKDEGRFEITNIPKGAALRLTVRRDSLEIKAINNVVPGKEELIVRVPKPTKAHIHGIVLDENGDPLPNAQVRPNRRRRLSSAKTNDKDTGAFEFGPMPAGAYQLVIEATGYAPMRTPYHTIADGDTWDAGAIRMVRGGTLRVSYLGDFVELPEHTLSVLGADGSHVTRLTMLGSGGQSTLLAPGNYRLQIGGKGIASKLVPFRIANGGEAKLDVPVQQGRKVNFHFLGESKANARLRVTITDANGEVRQYGSAWRTQDGIVQMSADLAPGTYRVQARPREDGNEVLHGEQGFTVGDKEMTVTVEMQGR